MLTLNPNPERTQHYKNFMVDSARWDDFEFRKGEIIISTPPKSGTTWTQMLCALLIFRRPEFEEPLTALSPWLDMDAIPIEPVLAQLEAQTHRRFIKTHTPLDGLPYYSVGDVSVCRSGSTRRLHVDGQSSQEHEARVHRTHARSDA